MIYRAKPVLVLAEQVSRRAYESTEHEAARVRKALGITDRQHICGGGLLGHIMVGDQTARPTDWVVALPDSDLKVLSDSLFRLLFAPAGTVATP